MSQQVLERRVAALEKQMATLMESLALPNGPKDWRQAIGLFPNNELMKQIDAAGRAIREADRRKARRNPVRKARKKP